MPLTASGAKRQVTLTLALGVLGAATLIVGNRLVNSGPLILVVYALVIVGTTWIVRLEKIPWYWGRFLVGLGVFLIASLGLYVEIGFHPGASDSITVLGHVWRFAGLLVLGAAVNLATARIAESPEPAAAG